MLLYIRNTIFNTFQERLSCGMVEIVSLPKLIKLVTLSRFLFTLPVSNGKLERIFSILKLIKVDKQVSLGNDTLNDLLAVNTNTISMKDFNPD